MRDITTMATVLTKKLDEKLEKLKQAQKDTAKAILIDVVSQAPVTQDMYTSSIKVSDTKEEDNVVKTSVYSNLTVFWKKINKNIPLAAFLEWGTGPLGESSNEYQHGYPYTTDAPWNYESWLQNEMTGTWGSEAKPHFYPALQKNISLYKNNLRKALKEK